MLKLKWNWIVAALLSVTAAFAIAPRAQAAPAPRPRVLLITSLALPPLEKIPTRYRSYFKTAKFRVEMAFREFFQAQLGDALNAGQLELAVLHDANAYDTWKAIKSPGNVAVFWFSHSGVGPLGGAVLQDAHGNNVMPVFQALHPDTRVLALTGCDSKSVSKSMQDMGFFPDSKLEIFGTDPRIEATHGFEQMLKESLSGVRKAVANYAPRSDDALASAACEPKPGYSITIRRELDPTIARGTPTSPVIVTLGGKLVTVFPPALAGDGQRQSVAAVLPTGALLRPTQLKIAVDGGAQASSDLRWLGDYEFEASWPGARWEVFAKPGSNAPMGTSTHVYRYKGVLDFESTSPTTEVLSSDCEAAELNAVTGVAHRTPEIFGTPGETVGAGTMVGKGLSSEGGTPLWARISVSGIDGRYKQLALVYGRINAEGVFNPGADMGRVPYLNLDFTALMAGRTDTDGQHVGIRLGAAQVSRDMPLDESRVIRVDLFGIQSEMHTPSKLEADPKRVAFMNVAADLIGYKSVERIRSSGGDFKGLHLVSSRTETGIKLKLSDRFQTRFLLGMESDVSVGVKSGGSPALYSKLKFYGQVRADMQNLASTLRVSAFAEASAPIVLETGEDIEAELRLIAGLLIAH
jgi:hypothetical protein